MKRLLALFILAATYAMGAEPATLKEVLAVEAKWQVSTPPKGADPMSFNRRTMFSTEAADAFLARISSVRSDNERKNAAAIAKLNWKQLNTLVLEPATAIDEPKAKSLRVVLEKIAAAPAASSQDQAELKRLLDSVPAR